jgi:16S rRNA (uracil1498-N3)-methyltransferase
LARRRFFVDTIRSGAAELRGEEARRLTRVLRVEPGQRYEICDNQAAWLAEIVEARGERVLFRLLEPLDSLPLPVNITLCAALIKFDRFEWMVEKATELGVERILPLATARVEKGLFEAARKRMERWVRIARESSQQSRRVHVPEILPPVPCSLSSPRSAPQGLAWLLCQGRRAAGLMLNASSPRQRDGRPCRYPQGSYVRRPPPWRPSRL